MKHSFLLLSLLLCIFASNAQVTKTIDLTTAGTLTSLLTSTEKTTVTNLIVTGKIDAQDIRCMRNEITKLAVLDLSQTVIQAYTGTNGPALGSVSYPANEMPAYSFYNSVTGIGKTSLKSIIFPQSITSVGTYACCRCSGLTAVNFSNNLKVIKEYAMGYLGNITSLTLPNSLETIGEYSFYALTSITSLTIPNSVNSIEYSAFAYARQLTTINSLNPIPPTLASGVFSYCPLIAGIYVPASSVNNYKMATIWGDGYYDKIFAIPSSNTFNLTLGYNAGGSVKEGTTTIASGSVVTMNANSTKTFTIVPIVGFKVTAIDYNGSDVLSQLVNNQFTTPSVNSDATFNVTFQKIEYELSIESAENGAVVMLCDYGATPSFKFVPSSGWQLNAVYYNGENVTLQIVDDTFTVPAITGNGVLSVSFVTSTPILAPFITNSNIQVYNSVSGIVVSGVPQGINIELHDIRGVLLQTEISDGNNIVFPAQKGTIYIIKTPYKTFKVIF